MESLLYQIALTLANGIGPVRARALITAFGTAEAVFQAKTADHIRVSDIGPHAAAILRNDKLLQKAEAELRFVYDHSIQPIFFTDHAYPERLRQCPDSPILLFTQGKMDLNASRIISVVGTRTATSYGKQFCEKLMHALRPHSPLVISGLAYGIDICAHRAAMSAGLPTAACLAHGLDRIYPSLHSSVAREMTANGGLITEFPSGTKPDRELFPMRNRIIAGIADCTVVIETDQSGGSMITAYLANGYGREVFALPGRYNDPHSAGCNLLIKRNVAAALTSPEDLADYLNWTSPPAAKQLSLFSNLSENERPVVNLIREKLKIGVDQIALHTGRPVESISSLLLDLEFRGVIQSLPGKIYTMAQ
jgi:DNA processing protein